MGASSKEEGKLLQLATVHQDIDKCRVCESFAPEYAKPMSIQRGAPGRIMIIGQGPGATEGQKGQAFAGQSGTTLNRWLIGCGADPDNPRSGIYFTALIKCQTSSTGKEFARMTDNCHPFLERQIAIVRPQLIITVGQKSYEYMRFSNTPYNDALCRPIRASEALLLQSQDFDYVLLPWPHPSGLNRWLNDKDNKVTLERSFSDVAPFLRTQT